MCSGIKVGGNFAIFVLAALFCPSVFADGYQTCTIPASRVVMAGGKEVPRDAAYKKVCHSILPPTCRNWVVDKKPCAYRSCVVDDSLRTCPNGDIVAFAAKETRPLTKEEMAAMNSRTAAEADKMARARQGTDQNQINGYEYTRKAAVNSTGGEMGYRN